MIALQLAAGPMRPARLREGLPGISTGVLERHLGHMVRLGLVTRTRFKEMPPRVELELTAAGRELLPVASTLARWGMRHMWSTPQGREQVDVGALLRLLPWLLEHATLPSGSVEVIVDRADPTVRCFYAVHQSHLQPVDPDGHKATARVRGDRSSWIAALGPDGDDRQLRIAGDRQLAKCVLDALPGRT